MTGDPSFAPDAATLGEVLSEYEQAGYTAQMAARDGGLVMCFACRTESDAATVELDALSRIEGVSDPADMMAVAALRCPACGARGTLVLNYGPESTMADAEVLPALEAVSVATTPGRQP